MLGELLWKEKEGKALERKHLQYIIVFSKTTSQGPLLSQLLRNLNLDENALIASHWMLFDILVLFFTVVQLIEFWLVNITLTNRGEIGNGFSTPRMEPFLKPRPEAEV